MANCSSPHRLMPSSPRHHRPEIHAAHLSGGHHDCSRQGITGARGASIHRPSSGLVCSLPVPHHLHLVGRLAKRRRLRQPTRPSPAPASPAPSAVLIAHNNTGTNNLGLIYMNARYYMPEVGRFISPDTIVPEPANPQSYNRYSYVLNSPMNYTDPTGHAESSGCEYEGCTWDSTPYDDGPAAKVYPYNQTVAVNYYYDAPNTPMHLYTSSSFGTRPASFVEQTYGGASIHINFEIDYLWMKFDVLRQHANSVEINAMAAREAIIMCNSGGGRCAISRVSIMLGAFSAPLALANGSAAATVSAGLAFIEAADAFFHNDSESFAQTVGTEIVGAGADKIVPGIGGHVIDAVDLAVDIGALSALESSYLEDARIVVSERLKNWRIIEQNHANSQ